MKNKFSLIWTIKLLLVVVVIALIFPVGNSAAYDDQPTIAKDSVQVTAFTFNV